MWGEIWLPPTSFVFFSLSFGPECSGGRGQEEEKENRPSLTTISLAHFKVCSLIFYQMFQNGFFQAIGEVFKMCLKSQSSELFVLYPVCKPPALRNTKTISSQSRKTNTRSQAAELLVQKSNNPANH